MPSFLADVKEVARGWRWGKRPLVPRAAEDHHRHPEPREFPTAWARTPAGKAAREIIQSYVLKPVVWTETRPRVSGLEVLEGLRPPVMFVSNHASHLDAPLVLCSLPKEWRERTAVGAAADYFFDVWWRAASTALVFNAFPIERAGSRRQAASTTARDLVADGWNIVVFPEGTRSRDGWVQRFRHGAARLCIELGIPAVPIAIRGAYAAMPRGRGWPRPGRFPISVRYGDPVTPDPDGDYRAFSAKLYQGLSRLVDEDRTTWFESIRREAEGETPSPTGPEAASWRRIWEAARPIGPSGPVRVWRR